MIAATEPASTDGSSSCRSACRTSGSSSYETVDFSIDALHAVARNGSVAAEESEGFEGIVDGVLRSVDYAMLDDLLVSHRAFVGSGVLLRSLLRRLCSGFMEHSQLIAKLRAFVALKMWLNDKHIRLVDFRPSTGLHVQILDTLERIWLQLPEISKDDRNILIKLEEYATRAAVDNEPAMKMSERSFLVDDSILGRVREWLFGVSRHERSHSLVSSLNASSTSNGSVVSRTEEEEDFWRSLNIYRASAKEIAVLLTCIDSRYLEDIHWLDLVYEASAGPTKGGGQEDGRIQSAVRHFNQTCKYVVRVLLGAEEGNLCKHLCKFIRVAMELARLQNYHSMMAVILALQNEAVDRQRHDWGLLSEEDLQRWTDLQHLASPVENFAQLRQLQASRASAGCDKAHRGYLPFLGLHLGDLFKVRELLSSEPVNFELWRQTSRIAKIFRREQETWLASRRRRKLRKKAHPERLQALWAQIYLSLSN